jgi:peptidyl-prolyl cis-trans isomerase B (cyclophilin B)
MAFCATIAAVLGLAACTGGSGGAKDSGQTSGPCKYTSIGSPARKVGLPPATPKSATRLTLSMLVGTSQALRPITIALAPSTAPCTVNSIAFLAGKRYFDNTSCERLTTQGIFVLQCGDPTGTGSGGPGYRFADELSGSETYPAGTVAMANSGPDTNGSQFFLVYRATPLPPKYTVFGRITAGLPVLLQEAKGGSASQNAPGDGPPNIPIRIATARAS